MSTVVVLAGVAGAGAARERALVRRAAGCALCGGPRYAGRASLGAGWREG